MPTARITKGRLDKLTFLKQDVIQGMERTIKNLEALKAQKEKKHQEELRAHSKKMKATIKKCTGFLEKEDLQSVFSTLREEMPREPYNKTEYVEREIVRCHAKVAALKASQEDVIVLNEDDYTYYVLGVIDSRRY